VTGWKKSLDYLRPDLATQNSADEFCARMLVSLPRSDQRRWGAAYINGLLKTQGRKTIRRIANTVEGTAAEQSLQQFVSKSTWEWQPVRRSLALYLEDKIRPLGWVAYPMVIPKAGVHSVGVERQFVTPPGRLTNCQRAVGLWMAAECGSAPVEWNIVLPPRWIEDSKLRSRAEIPEEMRFESSSDLETIRSIRETICEWGVRSRPVIISQAQDPSLMLNSMLDLGLPFVIRIGPSFRLVPKDFSISQISRQEMTVSQIASSLGTQRKRVEWYDHLASAQRSGVAVGASVELFLTGGRRRSGGQERISLALLGINALRDKESEYWLTNLRSSPLEYLVALAKLPLRVAKDQRDISEELGIKEFEGRSFRGWHHHATLVSIAHSIRLTSVLNRAGGRVPQQVRADPGQVGPGAGAPEDEGDRLAGQAPARAVTSTSLAAVEGRASFR